MCTNFQTEWLERSADIGKIVEYQRPTCTDFNDSRCYASHVLEIGLFTNFCYQLPFTQSHHV